MLEPCINAFVSVSISLTATTIPAALFPDPAPAPAMTINVSLLPEITSKVVAASTSESPFISAITEFLIKLMDIEPPIALLPDPAPPILTFVKIAAASASTLTKPPCELTVEFSMSALTEADSVELSLSGLSNSLERYGDKSPGLPPM